MKKIHSGHLISFPAGKSQWTPLQRNSIPWLEWSLCPRSSEFIIIQVQVSMDDIPGCTSRGALVIWRIQLTEYACFFNIFSSCSIYGIFEEEGCYYVCRWGCMEYVRPARLMYRQTIADGKEWEFGEPVLEGQFLRVSGWTESSMFTDVVRTGTFDWDVSKCSSGTDTFVS
jgi:hypothetical protein